MTTKSTRDQDAEREECLRHMNAEYGPTLTTDQIRFGIEIWQERARRARAAAAKAPVLARNAAERTGEELLPEHQA